ncbi:MAG TPA: ABC transporter substrate-binding protein [Desulfatirhabdiaceae bacterium]|nr:ABC transporter substrate-binding protein [Desulfatirhabdiaceae bacterium]
MKISQRVFLLFSFLAIFLPDNGLSQSSSTAMETVNYRLKWLFNASVVGDLVADVSGFFEKNGLKVIVKEGGPERDAIKELELGHAQFGVASADQVIRALSKGSPVVVIAQLFQVNPLQWIYRPQHLSIQTPTDMKGKRLGVTFGGNDETIMRTILSKFGMAETDVTLFSVRYDYTPFYQGDVELWPVYINAQAVIIADKLAKSGETVRFLNPDALGVKFVANSVITSEKMIREKPDTVSRIRKGLMAGWNAAMDPKNHARAIEVLRQFDRDTALPVMEKQLAATRPLIQPLPTTVIGSIDVLAWKETEQIMLNQKQIPAPVHVERVLKEAGF